MIPDKFVNISSVTHKCLNWFIKLSVFAAPFRSEIHSPRRPRAFSQSDEIDHAEDPNPTMATPTTSLPVIHIYFIIIWLWLPLDPIPDRTAWAGPTHAPLQSILQFVLSDIVDCRYQNRELFPVDWGLSWIRTAAGVLASRRCR